MITLAGKVTCVSDAQFLNALLPIFFNPSCNLTVFKFVHPLNAKSSILVTESGIVTLSNWSQSENALSPKIVNFSGKLICFKLLQLLNTPP